MDQHVIALLHDVIQWIIGAVVALGVPYLGYLSLSVRSRVTTLEADMAAIKIEHKQCMDDRKIDIDLLATPWPSDANEFVLIVAQVRDAMEKAGMVVDQRVVAKIIRKHELDRAKRKDADEARGRQQAIVIIEPKAIEGPKP